MIIDKKKKSLSDLMICIGELIKQYEDNLILTEATEKEQKLYKTKEVCKKYPALTPYVLDKAIKNNLISFVKIGNTNYFKSSDLEELLRLSSQED